MASKYLDEWTYLSLSAHSCLASRLLPIERHWPRMRRTVRNDFLVDGASVVAQHLARLEHALVEPVAEAVSSPR